MVQKIWNIILFFTLCTNIVFGQDYTGINFSRYFPLQNINNQPADLIRSDSRWHINVLTAQAAMLEDFAFKESGFTKILAKAGAKDLKYYLATDKALFFASDKIMLPSVSYKINHKNAIAFATSLRADGIYKSSNDDFLNIFRSIVNPDLLETLKNEHFKSILNSWLEFNFSWSGILFEEQNNLLTGGINLKYLSAGGSGYLDMDGIEVSFGRKKIDYFRTGLSYAVNSNLDKAASKGEIDFFGDTGVGMDIGLSYSFKPSQWQGIQDMPYKFKLGLTIRDIGRIKHKSNVEQSIYSINIEDVSYSRFKGIQNISSLIDTLQALMNIEEQKKGSFYTQLPTKLVLTVDYCFSPNWYISGLAGLQVAKYHKSVKRMNQKSLRLNITPRFENKKWGVFLPVTYGNRFDTTVGLAFRWRFIYVGSSTVIGNLFTTEKGQGELFLGINIPIGVMD